jgi:hypothetical protein
LIARCCISAALATYIRDLRFDLLCERSSCTACTAPPISFAPQIAPLPLFIALIVYFPLWRSLEATESRAHWRELQKQPQGYHPLHVGERRRLPQGPLLDLLMQFSERSDMSKVPFMRPKNVATPLNGFFYFPECQKFCREKQWI